MSDKITAIFLTVNLSLRSVIKLASLPVILNNAHLLSFQATVDRNGVVVATSNHCFTSNREVHTRDLIFVLAKHFRYSHRIENVSCQLHIVIDAVRCSEQYPLKSTLFLTQKSMVITITILVFKNNCKFYVFPAFCIVCEYSLLNNCLSLVIEYPWNRCATR